MTMRFNPLDYPVALLEPGRLAPSAWLEHVPFGMTLVALTRPRLVVELGTYSGVSYCSFCQAIVSLGLDCRAYAVDTWEGDPQCGYYGGEVFAELSRYHDSAYGGFSCLVRSKFEDARAKFEDGSIDLLHIDGLHTYEAVAQDFSGWLPKLSARAVAVFHDIEVRHADFGVWRLWDELRRRYPTFEFTHQYGLGIAAVGPEAPAEMQALFALDPHDCSTVRNYFCQLGRRLSARFARDELQAELAKHQAHAADVEHRLRDRLANQDSVLSQIATRMETVAQATMRMEAIAQAAAQREAARHARWAFLRRIYHRLIGSASASGVPAETPAARSRAA
jgi:hypothetical protein